MSIINTNTLSLTAQTNRRKADSAVSQAIERLASGLRINSAADDAAGAGIANRMTANLRANVVVARGINDGISLAQVAEGGLDGINTLVQRARELAVYAATETLSDTDRATLHDEFVQLREEIDRIAYSTEAFERFPLASGPPAPQPVKLGSTLPLSAQFPASGVSKSFSSGVISLAYIPVGARNVVFTIDSLGQDDDIQLFSRDGRHLVGTPLEGPDPDIVWIQKGISDSASADAQLMTAANGFLAGASYSAADLLEGGPTYVAGGGAQATYNGMTFTYSGDGDRYEDASSGGFNDGINGSQRLERLHIDEVTEELLLLVVGAGAFQGTATWDDMPAPTEAPPPLPPGTIVSEATRIVMGASYGAELDVVTLDATPADSVALNLHEAGLDPRGKAFAAIGAIDDALAVIDGYRGYYGAMANRFEGAISNLAQEHATTSVARSRILDADYAQEATALARAQIVQQAGTAVLVQSNEVPQTVLSLLR